MKQYDFCDVCRDFTDVYRYRRHWICDDCSKQEIDNKIEKKYITEGEIIEPIKTIVTVKKDEPAKKPVHKRKTVKPEKEKTNKQKLPPIRPARRNDGEKVHKEPKISCKKAVASYFQNHPNQVFRSYELWEKFPNYLITNVKNALSQLVREKKIYSRKINISGAVRYSIYSTNYSKVREFLEEENVTQIVDYINRNYPVTTKKLAEIFPISGEAITKRLKKVDSIEIFQYMNRNFYFPTIFRDSCIRHIVENTTWSNQ